MSLSTMLGAAKVNITPDFPVELQPFHPRLRADGQTSVVNRPLHVRTLVFRQQTAEGDSRYGVLISADIIYFVDQRVHSLRRKMAERWGVEWNAVLFQGTHTHSAPFPGSRVDASEDEAYMDYIELLEARIMESVEQAMANLEPVVLERGTGTCGIGTYRRRIVDGSWTMNPDLTVPVDQELIVLRFRRPDGTGADGGTASPGSVKALLVNFACHPTTTCDNAISSDFPGAAMDELEQELGGGAVSFFLQGCCGDVKVATLRGDRYYDGHEEDVARFGHELAAQVRVVLEAPMKRRAFVPFRFRHKRVQLPFQSMPSAEELLEALKAPNIRKEWAGILLGFPHLLREADPLEIHYYELGESFSIVALNGEVVGEYGRFIKAQYGERVLPVGYSNGHTTYIPTARQLAEGGYEGDYVFFRHGKPSPYAPSIERMIKEGMVELIDGRQN